MQPRTPAKYVLAALIALGCGSYAGVAQDNDAKTKNGKNVTLTGCVQKGAQASTYSLKSEDGTRYGLRSSTVGLSKHLGHKVTVTGTHIRQETEAKKEQEKKEAGEAGGVESADIRVTAIKHISELCQ